MTRIVHHNSQICNGCNFSNVSSNGWIDLVSHFFSQPYENRVFEASSTDTSPRRESGFSSEGKDYSVINLKGLLVSVSQNPETNGILEDKVLLVMVI